MWRLALVGPTLCWSAASGLKGSLMLGTSRQKLARMTQRADLLGFGLSGYRQKAPYHYQQHFESHLAPPLLELGVCVQTKPSDSDGLMR